MPPKAVGPLSAAFEEEFLGIDHWPQAWHVESQDLAPGKLMLDIFKVFLVHQLGIGRARKTCACIAIISLPWADKSSDSCTRIRHCESEGSSERWAKPSTTTEGQSFIRH
jgi:hypothetical protein